MISILAHRLVCMVMYVICTFGRVVKGRANLSSQYRFIFVSIQLAFSKERQIVVCLSKYAIILCKTLYTTQQTCEVQYEEMWKA